MRCGYNLYIIFSTLLLGNAKGSTLGACFTYRDHIMARNKKVSISIRTTPEIKELMRLGAERECRSIASMIEVLVVNCATA